MSRYNDVCMETRRKLKKVESGANDIKKSMSGEVQINYPKITEFGKRLNNAHINFLKYYKKYYKKNVYKKDENYNQNHKNIVKKAQDIGKSIKKIKIDPRLFPLNSINNVLNYSKMLNRVGNTMMSITINKNESSRGLVISEKEKQKVIYALIASGFGKHAKTVAHKMLRNGKGMNNYSKTTGLLKQRR